MRHQQQDLYRNRYVINHRYNAIISTQNKNVIDFTNNDYLNLANHAEVKKAFIKGVELYGLGSGASNFISGYFKSHQQLEEAFSEFLQRDKTILFNSGYHANLGVLTALTNKNNTIIADKLCHASIIDGIRLSFANYYRYRHNDINHAETLAKQHKNPIIITESVFSMQGNITDAKLLATLPAKLIIDDAHGIGVLGKNGKGICEYHHLTQHDVLCLITPLGKALGSFGAIVSGDTDTMETVLQFARTYCYTTASPPAVSHATLTSLKLLQQENWRREKLNDLIHFFVKTCYELGLSLVSTDLTPIKSIIVKSNQKALEIQQKLLEKNIYVSNIRPPTVPVNTARIRISLNCSHTKTQIAELLDELKKLL